MLECINIIITYISRWFGKGGSFLSLSPLCSQRVTVRRFTYSFTYCFYKSGYQILNVTSSPLQHHTVESCRSCQFPSKYASRMKLWSPGSSSRMNHDLWTMSQRRSTVGFSWTENEIGRHQRRSESVIIREDDPCPITTINNLILGITRQREGCRMEVWPWYNSS